MFVIDKNLDVKYFKEVELSDIIIAEMYFMKLCNLSSLEFHNIIIEKYHASTSCKDMFSFYVFSKKESAQKFADWVSSIILYKELEK